MSGSVGVCMDGMKARRILLGMTINDLAQQANVSVTLVKQMEDGGNALEDEARRILNVLTPGATITSNSQENPTVVTCTTHKFQTGDVVIILGNTGSDLSINGPSQVITRIDSTHFSLAIDCTTSGGTGGVVAGSKADILLWRSLT